MIGPISDPLLKKIQTLIPDIGMLLQPGEWRNAKCPVAFDNKAYTAHTNSTDTELSESERLWWKDCWWDEQGESDWLKLLDKHNPLNPTLFAVLPDRVGDADATLNLARRYEQEVRRRGIPIAMALQNGCDFNDILSIRPDYVLVGGDDDFKRATVGPACRCFLPLGIGVHVARVNTETMIALAGQHGATSVDGTGLNRWLNSKLPKISKWLKRERYEQFSLSGVEEVMRWRYNDFGSHGGGRNCLW